MTSDVIIPAAPDELGEAVTARRLPGQDFAWATPVSSLQDVKPGSRSDSDSYARSKDKSYKKKITKQKARKKA